MASAAKKNAFGIMFESSKLCWPPGPLPFATTSILEIDAQNGWFPWYDDIEVRQNPEFQSTPPFKGNEDYDGFPQMWRPRF